MGLQAMSPSTIVNTCLHHAAVGDVGVMSSEMRSGTATAIDVVTTLSMSCPRHYHCNHHNTLITLNDHHGNIWLVMLVVK